MTPALTAALSNFYQGAVIASERVRAVADLAAVLQADDTLRTEAAAYLVQLQTLSKAIGGVDRLKQRDFAAATFLTGLTEALA